MRTLRTASALLAIFAAACTSGDPVGPDEDSQRVDGGGAIGSGYMVAPIVPAYGGGAIGSGYIQIDATGSPVDSVPAGS